MDLTLSDDQRMLRDSAARLMHDEYDFEKRRRTVAEGEGFSRSLWKQFAELGWLGLPIASEYGGLDGDLADLALLFEQLATNLVVEPFMPTVVLAGGLISALGTPAQKQTYLPRIAAGELLFVFAHDEPDSGSDPWALRTTAKRSADGWQLTGAKSFAIAGPSADLILVTARTGTGKDDIGLFVVAADAAGLSRKAVMTMDGRRAADIGLADVMLGADALLGDARAARAEIQGVIDRATVVNCLGSAGAMKALVDRTVAYLKVREQFGKPLSANQVLRHRVVDMALRVEEARSSALRAILLSDKQGADAQLAASSAKAKAGVCAKFVSHQAVQLHGGMGVTEELDIGAYFKALLAFQLEFGSTEFHRRRHARLKSGALALAN